MERVRLDLCISWGRVLEAYQTLEKTKGQSLWLKKKIFDDLDIYIDGYVADLTSTSMWIESENAEDLATVATETELNTAKTGYGCPPPVLHSCLSSLKSGIS